MRFLILLLLSICLTVGAENPFANDTYIIEDEYIVRITWIIEDWNTGKIEIKVVTASMILPQILKLRHKITEEEWNWFRKFGMFNFVIYDTFT
jgi:hypothetical protein